MKKSVLLLGILFAVTLPLMAQAPYAPRATPTLTLS